MQNNPNRIRWDHFVTNTSNPKGTSPSKIAIAKNRQKPLPPVRNAVSTTKVNQVPTRQGPAKATLPPIDNNKKPALNVPVVFVLSEFSISKTKKTNISKHSFSFSLKVHLALQNYAQI